MIETLLLNGGHRVIIDASMAPLLKEISWCAKKDGKVFYCVNNTTKRTEYLHWYVIGKPLNGNVVDHINGNTLDDRRENLRVVSRRQNTSNRDIHRKGKMLGTTFDKSVGRWKAHIVINGRQKNLGRFATEQMAHEVYLEALKKI